jgi:hypothetical protein
MCTTVPPTSHQTVRLARGKHSSPDSGACVMELVSMLAGEPFSDRPRTACPVIASFLRSYNDAVDDERRQDLYASAAMVVGTRSSAAVERARALRCAETLAELNSRGAMLRRVLARRQPLPATPLGLERSGIRLARELQRTGAKGHARALALIEELVGIGQRGDRAPASVEAGGDPVQLTRA